MPERIVLKWGNHRANATLDEGLPDRIDTSEIFGAVTVWNEGRDRPSPPVGVYHLVGTRPIEYQWEGDR